MNLLRSKSDVFEAGITDKCKDLSKFDKGYSWSTKFNVHQERSKDKKKKKKSEVWPSQRANVTQITEDVIAVSDRKLAAKQCLSGCCVWGFVQSSLSARADPFPPPREPTMGA